MPKEPRNDKCQFLPVVYYFIQLSDSYQLNTICRCFAAGSTQSENDSVTEDTNEEGDQNDLWEKLKGFAG